MRKFVISVAAAGTALAFATPAAAQYYPQPQAHAYGHNNYGQAHALKARIDSVQRQIENLRNRRLLSRNEARDLRTESRNLERRLYRASSYGLNHAEMRDIGRRIVRLERHVWREARDGNRWGRGGNNGQHAYADRDRDGRYDRYEDDRGRDRDD